MLKTVATALCCWGVACATPIATLTLDNSVITIAQAFPSGGFSVDFYGKITNNTDFWLLPISSTFCVIGADPNLVDCSLPYNGTTQFGPTLASWGSGLISIGGAYQNATPPHNAYTVDYYLGTLNASYRNGFTETGNIFVHFELFDTNPVNPNSRKLTGALRDPSDPGNLEISAPATAIFLPEPGTLLLPLPALIAMGLLRLRRSRRV
jgi:hypothetical protein